MNGKRNGMGREYFKDGKIKFEGIYLFGIKYNGKGYDKNKRIIYEIKDGKGYIYELDGDGNLIYEGEYLNGKKNGKGKEYYSEGRLKFEGQYLNDIKWNGKGYTFVSTIACELNEGKGHFKEYDYFGNLIFEGEYKNGKRNGIGKEYNGFHLIFEGEYLNGKRNGKGKEYNYKGNLIFEGEYLNDDIRKGKFYCNNKLEFEGEYLFNKKWTGKGYDENGNITYELNNGNGEIKEYDNKGNLIFEGEIKDGKYLKGIEYYVKGLKFEGEYKDGKRLKGKEINRKGNIIYEGSYLNGKRWNGKMSKYNEIGKLYMKVKLSMEREMKKKKNRTNIYIIYLNWNKLNRKRIEYIYKN